jgi:hypothetical protein
VWRWRCRYSTHCAPITPAPPRLAAFPAAWFASIHRWACIHPFSFRKRLRDYELSPYLEVLKEFRDDFTVISGLSHPDIGPSHDSNQSFLTAAPHPERRAGFKNSADLIGKARLWFDLIHLALQTGSSRLIALQLLGTSNVPPINGL